MLFVSSVDTSSPTHLRINGNTHGIEELFVTGSGLHCMRAADHWLTTGAQLDLTKADLPLARR